MAYATNAGDTIVEIDEMASEQSAFSWNVAIVGALAAIAVSLLFYALGTGIGLTLVSPYSESNPSAGTMTAVGALWLIIAQSFAFATGGYLAGRLRTRAHIPGAETRFRDAAHGFMAWAIGVLIAGVVAAFGVTFMAGATTAVTASTVGNLTTSGGPQNASTDRVSYFVDTLFRSDPGQQIASNPPAGSSTPPTTSGTAQPNNQPMPQAQRDEVQRIMFTSIRNGKLDDGDKAYLSKLVAARTGLSEQEAERRVTETESKARENVKSAAETARKATAYMSFWTFMALLFGAVAGGLGGMVGGALRDEEWSVAEQSAR